jgi:hypothetical protein
MTNSQFLIPNFGPAARRGLVVVGSCLLMLVLGCDEGIDEYKPEPNVYCIIETGRDTVSLMAGMTLGYFDSIPDSGRWNGTAGVVARVTNGDSEIVLSELPGPVGFYRAEPVSILPGDTCHLVATYPDGAVVRGSTIVPDTFSLHELRLDTILYEPWPGETEEMLRLSLAWSESRGAAAYFEESWAWYKAGSDSEMMPLGQYPTNGRYDTLTLPSGLWLWDSLGQERDTLPLDRIRIGIRAVDLNCYDYYMLGWWMSGTELIHLDGGVGVFGSACLAETTLRFRPER